MGTNYYARLDVCSQCGRAGSEIHLGKSSFGWRFSHRAYSEWDWEDTGAGDRWTTHAEMIEWINTHDASVFDEYGDPMSRADFQALVESKQDEPNRHSIWVREHMPDRLGPNKDYVDPDGYEFSTGEFS